MRSRVPLAVAAVVLIAPRLASADLLAVAVAARVSRDASVFNRFTLTSRSGDPSTEYINATGVEIAVRFGR